MNLLLADHEWFMAAYDAVVTRLDSLGFVVAVMVGAIAFAGAAVALLDRLENRHARARIITPVADCLAPHPTHALRCDRRPGHSGSHQAHSPFGYHLWPQQEDSCAHN